MNFLEFGRCFDVTRLDVNFEHMIIYPCKQDPSGGSNLEWNHKWYYSEPTGGATTVETQIVVRVNNSTAPPSNTYCLTASATTLYPQADEVQRLGPEPALDPVGRHGGNYQTSFTFMPKGMQTKCIGLGGDGFEEANWSKMVLADCNGGIDQKWNAPPPEKVSASVGNYLESRGRMRQDPLP